ncbi:exosome subunit Rrp4 [Schizosaccharomyces cryophilus OY26]|uniref:Exosome subunit Rrp4 n=1 Tax=Schizosaccharomyces cryophilus (strain OY26 / ATCC MYA-4695 / CBS 11777 / NBRC 106824 / NRRL Y48691) TaxID=653667 RepID=S9W289_SCHCR|nr:exosome subunit Rrp4 [Schizosaccharomyces cryophilus OY26]EPY54158.1 exosome subunit Rrp4 [Schizosaccharomyces cryophilus OY26]
MVTILKPEETYVFTKEDERDELDTKVAMPGEEDEMEVDEEDEYPEMELEGEATGIKNMVAPGQLITDDPQFMRGHGTYFEGGGIYASVTGVIQRVNKLISVRPFKTKYVPEIGDLIIGRITEVQPKRWKVDIGSKQDAVLMLSSINLPGGVQRRKLETDELQMRNYFQEGDRLVAEVQQYFSDGSVSIHTRSLKYGKLRNGVFLKVPSSLVVRSKSHIFNLPGGVDLILSVNGYCWISKHSKNQESSVSITRLEEEASEAIYSNENDEVDAYTRLNISRMYICVRALANRGLPLTEAAILNFYEASLLYGDLQQLTSPKILDQIAVEAMH